MLTCRITPIEDLSLSDTIELTAVINRASSKEHAPFWEIFPKQRLDGVSLTEEYPGFTMVMLQDGDQIVGTQALGVKEEYVVVNLLSVAPEYRGHGLGSQLLDIATKFAKDRDRKGLTLEAIDVGRLIPFYQSLGFVEVSRITQPIGRWESVKEFELVTLIREVF